MPTKRPPSQKAWNASECLCRHYKIAKLADVDTASPSQIVPHIFIFRLRGSEGRAHVYSDERKCVSVDEGTSMHRRDRLPTISAACTHTIALDPINPTIIMPPPYFSTLLPLMLALLATASASALPRERQIIPAGYAGSSGSPLNGTAFEDGYVSGAGFWIFIAVFPALAVVAVVVTLVSPAPGGRQIG